MATDGAVLREAARLLLPNLFEAIDWGDVWSRNLSSGAALEWASCCALISRLDASGWNISLPLLQSKKGSTFFTLRNEIPTTFGGQAGNSSTLLQRNSLEDRFLFSLIPKAEGERGKQRISIFREGCPYHMVMGNKSYHDRADIVIMPGGPSKNYPKLSEDKTKVEFSYEYIGLDEPLSGELSVKNCDLIPCSKRKPKLGFQMSAVGIIECSVNKPSRIAIPQIEKYIDLFDLNPNLPSIYLITGNDLSTLKYPNSTVPVSCDDADTVCEALIDSADAAIRRFNLAF